MEKETLLTGIKKELGEPRQDGYIGDTGVHTRTLDAYVDTLLQVPGIKEAESVEDSFYAAHATAVKAMGGQMRFEQAEFIKKHKPKKQDNTDNQGGDDKEKDGENELLRRIEALENERENERKNSAVKAMRSKVSKKSEELKISNKSLWEDMVNAVEYTEGMTEKEMEGKAKELYEAKLKSYFGDGVEPYGGNPGGGSGGDEKALDSYFQRKVLEGKFPGKKD